LCFPKTLKDSLGIEKARMEIVTAAKWCFLGLLTKTNEIVNRAAGTGKWNEGKERKSAEVEVSVMRLSLLLFLPVVSVSVRRSRTRVHVVCEMRVACPF